MATAEAALVIHSAQQLEPGVETASVRTDKPLGGGEMLSPQSEDHQYPPSNVAVKLFALANHPVPCSSRVSFAGLRDPRLRMVRAIPLDVTRNESTVVVSWSDIDEFGTGDTLGSAIDDFASALSELHHHLFSPHVTLGPDLQKIKQTMEQYIQPRR